MNIRYNTSSEDQRYKTEEANTYIYIFIIYILCIMYIYTVYPEWGKLGFMALQTLNTN